MSLSTGIERHDRDESSVLRLGMGDAVDERDHGRGVLLKRHHAYRAHSGVCHFYGLDGHVRLHLRHHDLRGSFGVSAQVSSAIRRDQHELVRLLDFGFLGLHRSVSRETKRE